MKKISNLNTLNALIRDETMASKEYHELSMDKTLPMRYRKMLQEMSRDESSHRNNLINYREFLKIQKLRG